MTNWLTREGRGGGWGVEQHEVEVRQRAREEERERVRKLEVARSGGDDKLADQRGGT